MRRFIRPYIPTHRRAEASARACCPAHTTQGRCVWRGGGASQLRQSPRSHTCLRAPGWSRVRHSSGASTDCHRCCSSRGLPGPWVRGLAAPGGAARLAGCPTQVGQEAPTRPSCPTAPAPRSHLPVPALASAAAAAASRVYSGHACIPSRKTVYKQPRLAGLQICRAVPCAAAAAYPASTTTRTRMQARRDTATPCWHGPCCSNQGRARRVCACAHTKARKAHVAHRPPHQPTTEQVPRVPPARITLLY